MAIEQKTQKIPFKPFSEVLSSFSGEKSEKVSGLDFGPTLIWYKENKGFLKEVLKSRLENVSKANLPPISGLENLQISVDLLSRLIGLFPQKAQEKSKVVQILGEEPLWFAKGSTPEQPNLSQDKENALSPKAIVSALTDYAKNPNNKSDLIISMIHLNKMPDDAGVDVETAELITAEGMVHEYVHSILMDLASADRSIRLPDGSIIKAKDLVNNFKNIVEPKIPISHYSSSYRNENNEFKSDEKGDKTPAVSEEFAETVTTYLLGYASGNLTDITKDPLEDRVEVKKLIDDFLKSEVIKAEETSTPKTSS